MCFPAKGERLADGAGGWWPDATLHGGPPGSELENFLALRADVAMVRGAVTNEEATIQLSGFLQSATLFGTRRGERPSGWSRFRRAFVIGK